MVNILLVGQGDARHVLKTIAAARKRKHGCKIVFWLVENAIELLARQMLFLALAFEPTEVHCIDVVVDVRGDSHEGAKKQRPKQTMILIW